MVSFNENSADGEPAILLDGSEIKQKNSNNLLENSGENATPEKQENNITEEKANTLAM